MDSLPLPIADDAVECCEAIEPWLQGLDGPVVVPRIESLFELNCLCDPAKEESDFWRWVAIAVAKDLCPGFDQCVNPDTEAELVEAIRALQNRRYWDHNRIDAACVGEINLFIQRVFQGEMMTATATRPKSKPRVDEETDDELLKKSLLFGSIKEGAVYSDDELLVAIKERFRQADTGTRRGYHASSSASTDGLGAAIWFGKLNPIGVADLWYDPAKKRGKLLIEVRRVFNLPQPVSFVPPQAADQKFEEIKRNGKSRSKAAAAPEESTTVAELLAGMIVVEERDFHLAEIVRSAENPRQKFDQELIEQMAQNIENICRMSPITIREGSNEIIDGETRLRAGQHADVRHLRCKVVRCTDAQAASCRLLTSMQRRDLNPIERAQGLQALMDKHGLSQRGLSDLVKLQQGSIANLTRLLKLPKEWKSLVISGEITAAQARQLVPYIEEKAVLEKVLRHFKKTDEAERSEDFADILGEELWSNSRDAESFLNSTTYRNVDLKFTDEQKEQLRIHDVSHYGGKPRPRCFNVKLYDQIVADLEAKSVAARDRKESKSKGGAAAPSKAQAAANAKKQKEIFARKIYRYRTAWYQKRLTDYLDTVNESVLFRYAMLFSTRGDQSRDGQFFGELIPNLSYNTKPLEKVGKLLTVPADAFIAAASTALREFASCDFAGWHAVIKPDEFELLAAHAGIQLKRDWPLSCKTWKPVGGEPERECDKHPDPLTGYLDLLNKDQLLDLAAEWKLKLKVTPSSKRSEIQESIRQAGLGKPCPELLLKAEAVDLR